MTNHCFPLFEILFNCIAVVGLRMKCIPLLDWTRCSWARATWQYDVVLVHISYALYKEQAFACTFLLRNIVFIVLRPQNWHLVIDIVRNLQVAVYSPIFKLRSFHKSSNVPRRVHAADECRRFDAKALAALTELMPKMKDEETLGLNWDAVQKGLEAILPDINQNMATMMNVIIPGEFNYWCHMIFWASRWPGEYRRFVLTSWTYGDVTIYAQAWRRAWVQRRTTDLPRTWRGR